MNRSAGVPLRYHLMIYRREQLWLPAGLWALFAFLVVMFRQEPKVVDMAVTFVGFILPLLAGLLAASAVVEDPVLELQLTAARPAWWLLLERLAPLLGIVTLAALAYQLLLLALGVSLAALGGLAARQLAWLLPSLVLMGLASLAALGMKQGMAGALIMTVIWGMQILLRNWFAASVWARYIFLFMGALRPTDPALAANRLVLLALAVVLIGGAALLLKREERYL